MTSQSHSDSPAYLGDIAPRTGWLSSWERRRHSKPVHWFVECFAEALGVFLYTYAGVGATAVFVLGNILKLENTGSLLTVGLAYSLGVVFAIVLCSATSGGHFNPCITIVATLFHAFPLPKAIRYITAQILGGYIACLLVYAQYKDFIVLAESALAHANLLDATQFTSQGPGGILGLYVAPTANLGRVFLNEFVVDFFLALVIFGVLDPANVLCPPAMAPWTIGFAYGVAIWGYSPNGLAANSARDVGGRLAAISIYGMKASGGAYAAIAALTNIPATILAFLTVEILMKDSDRVVPQAHLEYIAVHKNHRRNLEEEVPRHDRESSSSNGKDHTEKIERV